jgi:hypothetical protein
MEKFSRTILVLVTILISAILLPNLYWMAFEKPIRKPFVLYSCINDNFMIFRANEGVREDASGKKYTREEYEQMLPLMHFQQLLVSGKMPDTIKGQAMEMHNIGRARSFFRYKPEDMNCPKPKLFPMFESQSGRANIEMPDDFFRITWRLEFLDAATNTIIEEKSQMFSAALYQKGFDFPATKIEGLPTTRKSCDEGYLIVDSSNQLFHLKMVKGKPFVRRVNLPGKTKFKHITCVDFKDKKYYAYLFSENNDIWILTQDDYELVKFPVSGFNAANCELKIYGDLFHYNVIIEADGHLDVVVLDKEYKNVDLYTEKWPVLLEHSEGKIFGYLFPAQLSLEDPNSKFISFYLNGSGNKGWILFNLILVGVHLFILRRRKVKINGQFLDLGIVAVTGIFGFIAVNFFQNKFFD